MRWLGIKSRSTAWKAAMPTTIPTSQLKGFVCRIKRVFFKCERQGVHQLVCHCWKQITALLTVWNVSTVLPLPYCLQAAGQHGDGEIDDITAACSDHFPVFLQAWYKMPLTCRRTALTMISIMFTVAINNSQKCLLSLADIVYSVYMHHIKYVCRI